MHRDNAMLLIVKPAQLPDYHGMAGEQAFYEALTLNLDWFGREMRAVAELLRQRRPTEFAGRTAPVPH